MREALRRVPFSMIGYVLLLATAVLLGAFVTLLATDGGGVAWAFGAAMVVALVISVVCFRIEYVESKDNEPGDETIVNAQPLIPPEEKSDISQYRSEHHRNT
ncbi:hypothetical protein [Gordonia aichiensis]|uniref:Uncharacterized protein n=1 Tax=Gordonia aichiensis NBRC 108223 TaxID=1220583 RepID=L7KLJ5_9ACTN|nr:hypothetical protein [Gordonia aichiensis]GAC49469.1 hypothetical protein GOACH_13_00610 [Gordonia aichiensis NBRC 108223]